MTTPTAGTRHAARPRRAEYAAFISLLHRRLFDELDDAAGKLGPVLRRAMARNRVTGLHHTGQWVDVGTPERLQSLDQWLHERARTS